MRPGLIAKPARFPKFKKFAIARRTMDQMFPVGILLQIFKSRGSGCEVPKDIGSGATVTFRIGIRILYSPSVLALQSIPLLFQRFAPHAHQPVIMA